MVWMDWTKCRVWKQTETALLGTRNWSGAQIGDSSEEVERWAGNPDPGSPNIQ